jgi:hypothetical protein
VPPTSPAGTTAPEHLRITHRDFARLRNGSVEQSMPWSCSQPRSRPQPMKTVHDSERCESIRLIGLGYLLRTGSRRQLGVKQPAQAGNNGCETIFYKCDAMLPLQKHRGKHEPPASDDDWRRHATETGVSTSSEENSTRRERSRRFNQSAGRGGLGKRQRLAKRKSCKCRSTRARRRRLGRPARHRNYQPRLGTCPISLLPVGSL